MTEPSAEDFDSLMADLAADDFNEMDDLNMDDEVYRLLENVHDCFVYEEGAFNRLVERVVPANREIFRTKLAAAELIRYVHYTCDPTCSRANMQQDSLTFYANQKKRSEPHYNIYKRLDTKLIKGDTEELQNVYEFTLILNTMEWMMCATDWMKVKAAGGAGKATGIIELTSPIEPGNTHDHKFVWEGQEMRRRRDIIRDRFSKKHTPDDTGICSATDSNGKKSAKVSKKNNATSRTAQAPVVQEEVTSPETSSTDSITSTPSFASPLAPREAALPAVVNDMVASSSDSNSSHSIHPTVLGIANNMEAKMQWLAAASAGNLEVIRGMLQLHREGSTGGAERPWTLDLNWCDHRKMTALSKAAPSMNYNSHHTAIMRELLNSGADPALQDVCGGFPLYYASCFGHLESVRVLLNDPRTDLRAAQGYGTDSLHIAANLGHLDVVELLLTQQHRLNIDNQMGLDGRSTLMGAITSQARHENRLPIVQRLLAAGINRNLRDNAGKTAFVIACLQGERAIAETILDHHHMEEPLPGDLDESAVPLVELTSYTTIDEFRNALLRASVTGNLVDLERLMEFSQQRPETADWVNVTHQKGASTLMVLAQLDFAIPSNAVDVVHMLVHAGADPNITNDAKQLPLMLTAKAGLPNSLDIMQILLEPGMADVNAQNPAGESALFLAAKHGHTAAVQFLMARMADGRTNHAGQTPSEAAYLAGHSQIAVILFEWP